MSGRKKITPEHAERLQPFRIPLEVLEAAGVCSVTDAESRETLGVKGHRGADLGGILFSYLSPLKGERVGARIRLDHPLRDGGKYISEPGCRHLFFAPVPKESLSDPSIPVVLVESEKAALAILALAMRGERKLIPIALGGCWGWKRKTGNWTMPNGAKQSVTGPSPDFDMIVWQGRSVILAFDSNALTNPKVQQARHALAQELSRRGARVLIVEVPAFEAVNGPDDLIALHGDNAMLGLLKSARPLVAGSPWAAECMETFLEGDEQCSEALFERILFRETITELFSPRGIGKSLFALFLAVHLALKGFRVLLLDRDNPRRVVRERLLAWGADSGLKTLKVITRENCPPLTNAAAWAEFPYGDYDVVVLDSLDAMAEGIGEQDSSKPSRAIAPLLDIARREGGPAVLVLGNCVKTGKHSRSNGVIEDRADIVFEVRDATGYYPSGNKPWFEELPPADAGSWAGRAARRKGREIFRLAFIQTKFRVGEEPEPFVMEINTEMHPWAMREVTDEIDRQGKENRERREQERIAAVSAATELVRAEVVRRVAAGERALLKKQAEAFLVSHGIKQKIARTAINSPAFEVVETTGQGHPMSIGLAGTNDDLDRNTIPTKPSVYDGSNDGDFGCPQPEHSTEIATQNAQYSYESQRDGISVHDSTFMPPYPPETNDDDEVTV